MSLTVTEVVIDCADHGAVVDFWAAALGYERRPLNEQYLALVPPEKAIGRPPILFQQVPEPKVVKNRVHLDFRCASMPEEIERLSGARRHGRSAERCLGDVLLDGAWRIRPATSSASTRDDAARCRSGSAATAASADPAQDRPRRVPAAHAVHAAARRCRRRAQEQPLDRRRVRIPRDDRAEQRLPAGPGARR